MGVNGCGVGGSPRRTPVGGTLSHISPPACGGVGSQLDETDVTDESGGPHALAPLAGAQFQGSGSQLQRRHADLQQRRQRLQQLEETFERQYGTSSQPACPAPSRFGTWPCSLVAALSLCLVVTHSAHLNAPFI